MCFLVFHCLFGVHLYFHCLAKLFRFYGRQVFLVYLKMLFGGRIRDLCNSCFAGDFALLGMVHVGVVDPTYVFV